MDYLGTVDYLTSPVSLRVEAWTHYDEWGRIEHNAVLKCGQRELDLVKRYATHDFDSVLELYYAKARFYDPLEQRFTAVDPILDPSLYDLREYVQNPVQFVQYLYVVDNPLCYIDPDGRMPVEVLRNLRAMYLGGLPNEMLYSICATLNFNNPRLAMHEFAQIYASVKTEIYSRFNEIILELPVYDPNTGGIKEADIVGYYGVDSPKEFGAIYEVKSASKSYDAYEDASTYMNLLNTCGVNQNRYKETSLFTLGPRIHRQTGIKIYSFLDISGRSHQMCMDIYSLQEGTIIYETYEKIGKAKKSRDVIQVFNIAKTYNIIKNEREKAKERAAGQLTRETGKTWTAGMLESLSPVVPNVDTDQILEVAGQVAAFGLLTLGAVALGSVLAAMGPGGGTVYIVLAA